jgi:putative NADPH-quinone reductase
MRVLLVLAHPDTRSFNHAIADTAAEALRQAGHDVVFHDLYAEGYDPLLPPEELTREEPCSMVQTHCRDLQEADGIVIVHPSWWGQPPAILKGWVDRTFRAGVAYRFETTPAGEGIPHGMLKATRAVVFNTANSAPRHEWGALGDPLEEMWHNTVLGFCGVEDFRRCLFAPVLVSSDEQRAEWLEQTRRVVSEMFAATPVGA